MKDAMDDNMKNSEQKFRKCLDWTFLQREEKVKENEG